MRVAVAATPEVAIPTLNWLLTSEHQLDFVISRPDQPAGRGRSLHESVVSTWAKSHGITVLKPVRPVEVADQISKVDLVIVIGYGVILPSSLLQLPKYGFVNLHFSLLPAWRGAAPVQRAIEQNDLQSGVTVFALDEGMDTGPIYIQEKVAIDPDENSYEVLTRMAKLGPDVISRTLSLITQGFQPVRQRESGISYAPKLRKEEAKILWQENAKAVLGKVLAFTPEPGAWTLWKGSKIEILRARHFREIEDLLPGHLRVIDSSLVVGCGDGRAIALESVKPSGKNEMSAFAWSNGARLKVGDFFG